MCYVNVMRWLEKGIKYDNSKRVSNRCRNMYITQRLNFVPFHGESNIDSRKPENKRYRCRIPNIYYKIIIT